MDTKKFPQPDVTDLDNCTVSEGQLIVQRYPKKAETEGGLIIPNESQECPANKVFVIKSGCPEIKVGDTVVVLNFELAKANLEILGENICVINGEDVVLCYSQGAK